MPAETVLTANWASAVASGVGAQAVLASLLSVVGFMVIITLTRRLEESVKAVHLALQLLHFPVSSEYREESERSRPGSNLADGSSLQGTPATISGGMACQAGGGSAERGQGEAQLEGATRFWGGKWTGAMQHGKEPRTPNTVSYKHCV